MTDSLGITTNKVTDQEGDALVKKSRARKYHLQEVAGRLLPDKRVSWCLHRPANIPGKTPGVEGWLDQASGRTHYRGLAVCSSVWVCPICASRISEGRRVELEDAVSKSGLTPILVTVTLQHAREDRLTDLIEDLTGTLRTLKMGGWWTRWKNKWGIQAYVSSLEVTWGVINGWHPHKHWLLFASLPEEDLDQGAIKGQLTERWADLLQKKTGRYASAIYSIDVQVGNKAAGAYTAKWGLASEVTKAVTKISKTGLSPWQLLELYDQGDQQAGALFAEYALATEGKRQLVWSKGGRAVLGLGEEVEDEDLAAEEVAQDTPQAVMLIRFDKVEWGMILKAHARCKVLELLEDGGVPAVQAYLDRLWQEERKAHERPPNESN